MKTIACILPRDAAQERVVVLPNVQTFHLAANDGELAYELAAYILCPSASEMSLMHERPSDGVITNYEICPTSASIQEVRQRGSHSR